MNETGNQAENRTAGQRQTELLADVVRVRTLAFPIPGAKRLRQLGAHPRIPAFVDPVQYPRQLCRMGAASEQTLTPVPAFCRGDFAGVGVADVGQMGTVVDAAFEQG